MYMVGNGLHLQEQMLFLTLECLIQVVRVNDLIKMLLYIKTFIPQLNDVTPKLLHEPINHEAELEQEGIKLGQDYPKPLVDHKEEEIMLCQYLNKYKNNWSEIAIKLNVVSLQFTFVRREWGRNNIFQNLFYPSLLCL